MTTSSPGMVHVKTTINGQAHELLVPPYMSLLDTLRELIGLTGTKEGCLDGNCGACTVSVDGRIVDSCLVLGAEVDGKDVDTVEGMASADGLHPLQQAAFALPDSWLPPRAFWITNRHPVRAASGTGSRETCAAAPVTTKSSEPSKKQAANN